MRCSVGWVLRKHVYCILPQPFYISFTHQRDTKRSRTDKVEVHQSESKDCKRGGRRLRQGEHKLEDLNKSDAVD